MLPKFYVTCLLKKVYIHCNYVPNMIYKKNGMRRLCDIFRYCYNSEYISTCIGLVKRNNNASK